MIRMTLGRPRYHLLEHSPNTRNGSITRYCAITHSTATFFFASNDRLIELIVLPISSMCGIISPNTKVINSRPTHLERSIKDSALMESYTNFLKDLYNEQNDKNRNCINTAPTITPNPIGN